MHYEHINELRLSVMSQCGARPETDKSSRKQHFLDEPDWLISVWGDCSSIHTNVTQSQQTQILFGHLPKNSLNGQPWKCDLRLNLT